MIGHNNEAHRGFRGQYGAYYLLYTLGHGGFGKVYLGEHMHLHTKAAVKVLHEDLVYPLAGRFKREAKTVAQLPPHPHVVRVLDYNVQNGRFWNQIFANDILRLRLNKEKLEEFKHKLFR